MKLPKPYLREPLTENHDVSRFDCDNTYLNLFLKEKALDEMRQDLSQTFVLCDRALPPAETVFGYFTLRADSIIYPRPNGIGTLFFPVVELAYLARHIKCRGEGIGGILLAEVYKVVAPASKAIGIAGVHLSYTDDGKSLYERYGFGPHPYGSHLLLLPIREIRAALEIPD